MYYVNLISQLCEIRLDRHNIADKNYSLLESP